MSQDVRQDFNVQVGAWLKSSRLKAGLEVETVAGEMGIPVMFIDGFESGKGTIPAKMLVWLVRLYQVPSDEFARFLLAIQRPIQ